MLIGLGANPTVIRQLLDEAEKPQACAGGLRAVGRSGTAARLEDAWRKIREFLLTAAQRQAEALAATADSIVAGLGLARDSLAEQGEQIVSELQDRLRRFVTGLMQ